jgi:hypothetical protein
MHKWLVAGLVTLIVVAHVFMWRSEMPYEAKLTFTVINTVAWTLILAPILLIDRWLNAVQRRNAERHKDHH